MLISFCITGTQRSGDAITESEFDDETSIIDDEIDMGEDDDVKTAGGTKAKPKPEKMNIVKAFTTGLTMFLPVALSEQQFCIEFFKFDGVGMRYDQSTLIRFHRRF